MLDLRGLQSECRLIGSGYVYKHYYQYTISCFANCILLELLCGHDHPRHYQPAAMEGLLDLHVH